MYVYQGKNFDKAGEKVTWWDSKVTDVFNKKAECFVDQYSKFSFGNSDDFRASIVFMLTYEYTEIFYYFSIVVVNTKLKL